jgi:hypothetical protein
VLLNALYLATGLVGLPSSRTPVGSRLFLICSGIGYFALAVYGFAIGHGSRANFVPLNRADSWLHLVLSAVLFSFAWIAAHLHEAPPPLQDVSQPGTQSAERAALEGIERGLAEGRQVESLPAVAWLAGRDVSLDAEQLQGARRRAVLLLAAGGDPLRGLALDGRAVTALAYELDDPRRRDELRRGLERLRGEADGLPAVCEILSALLADGDFAWQAFACGQLAEELAE